MKDRKFLSLLNLYLDGEIDSATALDLEREIQSNPSRRRIYTDYCRIHRATKLVHEQFRVAADDRSQAGLRTLQRAVRAANGAGTERKRLAGGGRVRPFPVVLHWASGFAAACMVALVVFSATRWFDSSDRAGPRAEIADTTESSTTQDLDAATYSVSSTPSFRTDPYIVTAQPLRRDPFALRPMSTQPPFSAFESGPATFSTLPAPAIAAENFSPFDPYAAKNAQESRVFRSQPNGQRVQLKPVGFQIHR